MPSFDRPQLTTSIAVTGWPAGVILMLALCTGVPRAAAAQLWETNQSIPTYKVAPADPNPRFYNGRTYQGAKATFYPYPVMDKLLDEKADKTYRAVYLENDYIQISVLPELGGRIFSAVDKANGYNFFYRQHVIKPALIGMLGAWISGGVEWNVPHHHRATSFMPVDYTTQENPDGSKTVWVGEIEWRHRMKWMVGLTLWPDRSFVEMTVKMVNRTPFAHSLLFWINPAVHANEQYQVIFPPGTEFAVQHAKPEFASWPMARQVYGGTDYTRGVDISWWKNHPSPVSFFAWNCEEDWFGGYDHGQQAGTLQVSDHHVAPGKKFFEWGVGDDGKMWSTILTDSDGPYLELMAGAWSDNQPDYSWLQPGEAREWKHFWYPIRNMGGVKNANTNAAVNLEVANRTVKIAFNTTRPFADARVQLRMGEKSLFEKTISISPSQPFSTEVMLENEVAPEQLRASLQAADGRELVAYQPKAKKNSPMPKPVQRPQPPKDYKTADELYFTGQRIEQLYSPSFEAAPYYEEALRRDPGDYRANTALGILLCKQWRWPEAEARLRAAIGRATDNYIRPKDGEAFYYLGVALKAQGKLNEAFETFHKAVWSKAWQSAGYLALAEIDCARGRYTAALDLVDRSIEGGGRNTQALNLKTTELRLLGRFEEARQVAESVTRHDPLDFRAAYELALLEKQLGKEEAAAAILKRLREQTRGKPQVCLEYAYEYANAGLWQESTRILRAYLKAQSDPINPLIYYTLAFGLEKQGDKEAAAKCFEQAGALAGDFCFPYRWEEEAILRRAAEFNPKDSRASYYLGNLLYDNQPAEAIKSWERSRQLDDAFALAHRNLGLAYAQTEKDVPKAITSLEKAITLNLREPRFLYELDVQYEAGGAPIRQRLDMLTGHAEAAAQRDDTLAREIQLLTAAGEHDQAVDILTHHRFHNWEGGGEIHAIYVDAMLQRGQARLRANRPADALKDFEAALEHPANLEVGRSRRDRGASGVSYHLGSAHEALGNAAKAREFYEKAVSRKETGGGDNQYCQGLAYKKLGRDSEAKSLFEGLIKQGQEQQKGREQSDYFAKFGERRSERIRQADGHYLTGLGYFGLGQKDAAAAEFKKALELHPAHLGANARLRQE